MTNTGSHDREHDGRTVVCFIERINDTNSTNMPHPILISCYVLASARTSTQNLFSRRAELVTYTLILKRVSVDYCDRVRIVFGLLFRSRALHVCYKQLVPAGMHHCRHSMQKNDANIGLKKNCRCMLSRNLLAYTFAYTLTVYFRMRLLRSIYVITYMAHLTFVILNITN